MNGMNGAEKPVFNFKISRTKSILKKRGASLKKDSNANSPKKDFLEATATKKKRHNSEFIP